jgi:hypothetical protein
LKAVFFFFLPSSVSRIISESESKCSRLTFFFVLIFLVSFPPAYYTCTCFYHSSSISSLISSSFSVSRLLYYLLVSSSSFYSNSPFVLSPLQLLSSNFSFYSHFSFRFFEFFSSPNTFVPILLQLGIQRTNTGNYCLSSLPPKLLRSNW